MKEDEFVYLYKLKVGVSAESSHAHVVALDAGIDEEVVDRAHEVLTSINRGHELKARPGFHGFDDFDTIAEDFLNIDLTDAKALGELFKTLKRIKL